MDQVNKFLRKIDAKLRKRLQFVIHCIEQNQLQNLDVQPLRGAKNMYRCRMGNVRVIFMKMPTHITIISMEFRKSVYKK